jgi:hypothetical protein
MKNVQIDTLFLLLSIITIDEAELSSAISFPRYAKRRGVRKSQIMEHFISKR